ncbi:MAG: DNA topoisomerase I, partial [Bdellovibrionales bacterium]|nr:DNA topoisomerase I [Bdellovibrionales bacterium]
YELIWMRTLASQMKDAHGTRVSVQIACEDAKFRASGKTIEFPGFLRAYVEGSDDPEAELADKEKILPPLKEKDSLNFKNLEALEHETKPPARYTEGSLIKELERLGIGRPSTWATIVDVVLSRNYAFKKGSALVPTFLAMVLTSLMERYFETLVDYDFTAKLEDDLDAIARGEADNQKYLANFYHGNGHPGLDGLVKFGEENIDPRDVCGFPIGTGTNGKAMQVRIGRYGPFLTNEETTAGIPEILAPDELTVPKAQELLEDAARGPQSMGAHPEDGKPVYLKTGRYGPYVQWGDQEEGSEEKPKMASLLTGMLPDDVTLEIAVKLLSLPRILGKHPESKEEIQASNGRYGPYIKCGSDTRSLSDDYSPLDVTLEDALYLLAQPKRRGRGAAKKPLKEFGLHPVSEKPIVVKTGQFGPYVTDGTLNASIPTGRDIQSLTMEDAINLLDARAVKVAEKEAEEEAEKALGDDEEAPAKKSTAKKKTSTKKKSASKTKSKAKKKTTK